MEQPCYKCGQAVEEGIPFCPHCSAPQIRVVITEPAPLAAAAADPATSSHSDILPAAPSVPALALPVRWSHAVAPCALAALVSLLLMFLGLNVLVALVSAGFLAVIFYRQRQRGIAIRAGSGARLGALSGLFYFGVLSLLGTLAASLPDVRTKIRGQIIENAQKWAASRPGDPQVQAALDQLKTPQGLIMILIIAAVVLFVLSLALGALGGALGGSFFGRHDKS